MCRAPRRACPIVRVLKRIDGQIPLQGFQDTLTKSHPDYLDKMAAELFVCTLVGTRKRNTTPNYMPTEWLKADSSCRQYRRFPQGRARPRETMCSLKKTRLYSFPLFSRLGLANGYYIDFMASVRLVWASSLLCLFHRVRPVYAVCTMLSTLSLHARSHVCHTPLVFATLSSLQLISTRSRLPPLGGKTPTTRLAGYCA